MGRSLTLLLASCLLASGQTIRGGYNISTVAGSNFAGDGGPAIQGLLSQPEGIAVDSKGVVYVADADDHRVRKISTDGNIYTIAGNGFAGFSGDGGPAAAAQLNSPYGLCLDRSGNLYIADLGNARVRRISPDGSITTVAGGGTIAAVEGGVATAAKLSSPRNVAVDSAGNLYVSDFNAGRIYRVSPGGTIITVAGGGATSSTAVAVQAMLRYPAGIAVDSSGVLYIADTGSTQVLRVFQGVLTTVTGAFKLTAPIGLALDRFDNLLIAEGGSSMIRLSPAGVASVAPIGGGDAVVDQNGHNLRHWLAHRAEIEQRHCVSHFRQRQRILRGRRRQCHQWTAQCAHRPMAGCHGITLLHRLTESTSARIDGGRIARYGREYGLAKRDRHGQLRKPVRLRHQRQPCAPISARRLNDHRGWFRSCRFER